MMEYLLVFLGGGLGAVCRFGISKLTFSLYNGSFPIGTLISNTVSCLIVVLVLESTLRIMPENSMLRTAVLVGFCGGLSTFSTFSFETVQLMKNGNHLVAAGNVILSVGVCFILIYKLTK